MVTDNGQPVILLPGRQPEPVSYYHQEIEIRKGFNIENPWDIKVKNSKDPKLREKKKTDNAIRLY